MPKCILIADDSKTIRTLIRTFIENRAGFEVCGEAVDGADAIEKAKELKPDLMILDLAHATDERSGGGGCFCFETQDAKNSNNIVYDV
jgi:chemotaxis response regulator CheB